ncbi:MAG: DUF4255 domain-containing protein [Gemmatimonadaceae bacterium]|nr:DUF4255 domain-containing protein [Gemmatimonadaceae bacterium]
MLKQLDRLIRRTLRQEIPSLATDAHVRFQPPDAALRADVIALNAMALDVYLIELRENRKLRANGRTVTVDSGQMTVEQWPARLACHYLVSAWSPIQSTALEPALDEHTLLYEAASALMHHNPLNPSSIYPPLDPELAAWPVEFRADDLPVDVLTPESFGKHSDFWTTMGTDSRWKPIVQLVVTLPIANIRELSGWMVTTRLSRYRITDHPETDEQWIEIGGTVVDALHPLPDGTPAPVVRAWVRLETPAGALVQGKETDESGRFTFQRIRAASYRLRSGAIGLGVQSRLIDIPSETGEYDLRYP